MPIALCIAALAVALVVRVAARNKRPAAPERPWTCGCLRCAQLARKK